MKNNSLLITLGLLAFHLAAAQDSLTINQALQRVMASHPALEQANQTVRAAEARTLQSTAPLLPDVAGEVGYTFLGPIAKFDFPGFGSFRLYPADNYDAHIGGRYTIYDFGKTDALIDVNRSLTESARDAVMLTKTGLAYQTIRTFYTMLFLDRAIQVQKEQIEALNRHITITQQRVATGSATKFEVLTTQVRVAAAQNQEIELENASRKQGALFAQLLGIAPDAKVALRGDFSNTTSTLDVDSLINTALQNRVEMRLVRDAALTAQLQVQLASVGNKPSLRMGVEYGFKNGMMPNIDIVKGNWVATIKAEVPIFDGWRTQHQEEEAEAHALAGKAHGSDVERQIRSDVEQVAADVRSAAAKIPITELQVKQAEEAVAIAQQRYEAGTVTNLDLLDAQAAESAARLGNLQALYRLVLSKYDLERALGILPAELGQ